MNENFREIKLRIRRLDEVLMREGGLSNIAFAQAVSRVHRLERRGDRSREPGEELRSSLESAETLARALE